MNEKGRTARTAAVVDVPEALGEVGVAETAREVVGLVCVAGGEGASAAAFGGAGAAPRAPAAGAYVNQQRGPH
jgi:hypothetical protein